MVYVYHFTVWVDQLEFENNRTGDYLPISLVATTKHRNGGRCSAECNLKTNIFSHDSMTKNSVLVSIAVT